MFRRSSISSFVSSEYQISSEFSLQAGWKADMNQNSEAVESIHGNATAAKYEDL
jgi:hypothetical protein